MSEQSRPALAQVLREYSYRWTVELVFGVGDLVDVYQQGSQSWLPAVVLQTMARAGPRRSETGAGHGIQQGQ